MRDRQRIKTQQVSRQVIQNKLLVALDDDEKVAIVLSEEDLNLLIGLFSIDNTQQEKDFCSSLVELRQKAFGSSRKNYDVGKSTENRKG